jgi:signal peptidase I
MPGETVQMREGRLYINGEIVPREFIKRLEVDEGGTPVEMLLYKETLPGGVEHFIYEETDTGALDNTAEFVVPEGHYFMMGDNRDNSQDSRVIKNVGPVPLENMIGKANIIFFSTDGSAHLWEIWKWPFATRFTRLFNSIHADLDDKSAEKVKGL